MLVTWQQTGGQARIPPACTTLHLLRVHLEYRLAVKIAWLFCAQYRKPQLGIRSTER